MFKMFHLHLFAQCLPEDHDALCTFSRISRTLLSRLHQSASQKPKGVFFSIGFLTEEPLPLKSWSWNSQVSAFLLFYVILPGGILLPLNQTPPIIF